MRRLNTQSFNKEQMLFMVCSTAFAVGLYLYLASSPVPLVVTEPISAQPLPSPLTKKAREERLPEDFYVVNMPGMIDRHTNEPLNRLRKTPFAPASGFRREVAKVKPPVDIGPPPPPPPPPPAEEAKVAAKDSKKTFTSKDAAVQLDFMGVVTIAGQTYGLLKPKDGTAPRRVKAGDLIPELNYTVTRIEKQAIYVTDADKHPFILKDTRFSEPEPTPTTAAGKDGDGATDEAKPDATAKPDKAPPKAAPAAPATPTDKTKPPKTKTDKRPPPGRPHRQTPADPAP